MRSPDFTENELDWIRKRALDRIAEVEENPEVPSIDAEFIEFLKSIAAKADHRTDGQHANESEP